MAAGSSEKIIVSSTIDLAHHLRLRAVAEGVEDCAMLPSSRRWAVTPPRAMRSAARWPAPTPPVGCLDFRTMAGFELRDGRGGMILIALAGLCVLSACP